MAVEDAAEDETGARRHLLERMREDVKHRRVLEAVAPDGRDALPQALVAGNGNAEPGGAAPEPVVHRMVDGSARARVRPHERPAESEAFGRPLELADRRVDVDERQHGDSE